MLIKSIPINSIVIKENHRLHVPKEEVDQLASSIKEVGLLQPIELYEDGKGKYEYAFGYKRILACKKLGMKTIMASIKKRTKENGAEVFFSNITENLLRSNPTFPEFGRGIEQLHENMKIPLSEIAKKLGQPETNIRRIYQTWTKLPKKHRENVKFFTNRGRTGGGIGASVAHNILNLKKKHGLSKKNEDLLFKHVNSEKMSKDNIETMGILLKEGAQFDQALGMMGKFKSFYVEIIADHIQVEDYKKSLGLPNTGLVFKRILYGQCPPLDKPKFLAV